MLKRMNKIHRFVCKGCPVSCEIELREEEGKILEVTGNICRAGEEYAVNDLTSKR